MDYYVDGSGPDGDGSFGNPWNNISGHVDDLAAGDTMHVRTGTYNEVTIRPTVSGASGNRIVLKAYNDEAVILQCSVAGDPVLEFDGVSYWTIEDMDIDKEANGEVAVLIENGAHHITLLNCDIHNAAHFALVYIVDGDDTLIDGCNIYDNNAGAFTDAHGILMWEGSDVTITRCTIYDCRGDGFQLEWLVGIGDAAERLLIEDNDFYVTPAIAACCEEAMDFKTGPTAWADHITIRENRMRNYRPCNGSCGGTSNLAGDAIGMRSHTKNVLIEENEIYNCATGIYAVFPDGRIDIQKNLIRDLVLVPEVTYEAGIAMYGSPDVRVHNNTLCDVPNRTLTIDGTTVVLRNNIFKDGGIIRQANTPTIISDHNLWFNCTDTIVGTGDVTADPLFTNEAAKDYTLQAASPAIDAGVNVGLPYFGSAPDMGYWEYQAGGDVVVHLVVVTTVLVVVVVQQA